MSCRPRVVILGASNATRGLPFIAACARAVIGEPIDLYAACGHGRSYGLHSRVLVRTLPPIVDCGLWEALTAGGPHGPVYALVTDVGNDIMYGAAPPTIAEWVRCCLERLRASGEARLVVTGLPLASIRRLQRWRYRATKLLLFPTRSITYEQALERSEETDRRLREVADEAGAVFIEPPAAWYGFDPVHIRLRLAPQAWRSLMAHWRDQVVESDAGTGSLRCRLHLRLLAPDRRWLVGIERRRRQPAGHLPDGTIVSLF